MNVFKTSLHCYPLQPPVVAVLLSKSLFYLTLVQSPWLSSLTTADSRFVPISPQLLTHSFSFLHEATHFPHSSAPNFVLTSHYKPHCKVISQYLAIGWILHCLGISSTKEIHSLFVSLPYSNFTTEGEHSQVLLPECTVI